MPENETPIPGAGDGGPVTPPISTPGGTPAAPPATPPDDWKARHDGLLNLLNKQYQRIGVKKLDELPDAQTWASLKTAAEQLASLQQEKETLTQTHQSLQADYELRDGELSGLRAQATKLQLLAEKYPNLGRFHGNIETRNTPEEQEQAIQVFQASLQSYLGSQAQGAPPPPGGGIPAGGSVTLEAEVTSAWSEYNQAVSGMKSREEIQRAFEKYVRSTPSITRPRAYPTSMLRRGRERSSNP